MRREKEPLSLVHWLTPGLPVLDVLQASMSTIATLPGRELSQPSPPGPSSPLGTNPFLWLPRLHMEFSSCIPYQDSTIYVSTQDQLLESPLTPRFPPCLSSASHHSLFHHHCSFSISTALFRPLSCLSWTVLSSLVLTTAMSYLDSAASLPNLPIA